LSRNIETQRTRVESESRKKRDLLQAWIEEVVSNCVGDKHVAMFLAKDGSVPPEQARQIGCDVEAVDDQAAASRRAGRALALQVTPSGAALAPRAQLTNTPARSTDKHAPRYLALQMERDAASRKMAGFEVQPTQVAIVKAVTRQGDPEMKTQTEVYTAYWVKVWTEDSQEWVVEKRFSAFKALRKNLRADSNPALRNLEVSSHI
jgi:hypothetical protein